MCDMQNKNCFEVIKMTYMLVPDEDLLKYAWYFPVVEGIHIQERYYNINQVSKLLRQHKNNPDVVQYIADMLEI
jgi:hypothetical protein